MASLPMQPAPLISQDDFSSKYISVDEELEQIPPPFDGLLAEFVQRASDAEDRLLEAKAFFATYDFQLREQSWNTGGRSAGERIHKDIRMRVRYTCHKCQTSFGREKLCIKCQHRRCSRCARNPSNRDLPRKSRQRPSVSELPVAPSEPTTGPSPESPPENATANNICHECRTGFETETEECPNCQHKICERCMRELLITLQALSTTEQVVPTTDADAPSLEEPLLPPEQKPPPEPNPVVLS